MQRLDFDGVAGSVLIEAAPDLVTALRRIAPDWPCEIAQQTRVAPEAADVLASVTALEDGLTLQSRYADSPLPGLSLAAAACALAADLSQGFVDHRPDLGALHCGAVEVNGRLVALTGAHRAGKSTLIARLTAEPQMRVFCDDVLPILPDGQGLALGISPRLRLPLPERVSTRFRTHVARHVSLHDDRYAYVSAPGQAPHGTTAPLSVIVVLDRRDAGAARLHPIATDMALRHVLARNLADLGSAEVAFAQMHALVSGTLCLRMVYADLEEAVALLHTAFGGPGRLNPALPLAPDDSNPPATAAPIDPVDPHLVWRHHPQVARRQVGQSSFLWMPDDTVLHHLNPLGAAIWALLEIPGSATDLAEALAEVFPEHPMTTILTDTARLLAQLAKHGMILSSDA
ncbi:PqqD family protein [Pseudotabrizicola formosa]|uniref:PqqD family protein n=1 Tax=Pseudotabrizicola formosa TaxID=2030009 RepID=UPI00143CE2DF|nr:PqqD family protein [Pseudotabrizicola formosa]